MLTAGLVTTAGFGATADAAPPTNLTAPAVKAGSTATLNVGGADAYCRLAVDGRATTRRAPAASFQAHWSVPRNTRTGTHRLTVGCGDTRAHAKSSKTAKAKLVVRHGHGRGRALPAVKSLRLRSGESLSVNRRLPPGSGNPKNYHAPLSAGSGGGPFATYLPFAQGLKVPITQGPGGTESHYTQYTKYAVDLGVPAGTEIRAGFTGVIARVKTGCVVGDRSCGDGYGNYIYEKANDDSCVVYAHLTSVNVRPGQQVTQYDVLGSSGETGNAWGAHLHFSRVNCTNNIGMPWAAIETDQLGRGTTVTSGNHPPEQPCTAIQGGCGPGPQQTVNPQPTDGQPIQGTNPSTGGGGAPPAPSITAAKGGAYKGGNTLDIAVHNFPTGTFTYECHDNSGPGGADTVFYTRSVTVTDANQSSWPGVFCYDSAPFTAYLVMKGVGSNAVAF